MDQNERSLGVLMAILPPEMIDRKQNIAVDL